MASNAEVNETSTSSNSTPMSKQETFVIETDSKIKRELKRKDNKYSLRPSFGVVVLKWLSTVLLFLLLLAFVIFSKVGMISISQQMSRGLAGDAASVMRAHGVFVSLQIATVVPHVFSFLRGIFEGAFRKDIPWPTRRSLILGVVLSIVESVGTTLFVFCLPGLTGPGTTVLLMSGVFLVPVLYDVVHSLMVPPESVPPESTNSKWTTRIFFVVALLLELAGLAFAGYAYYNHKTDPGMDASDAKRFGVLVTALLCLSISWIPGIQSFLLDTRSDAVVTFQAEQPSDNDQTHAKERMDNNAPSESVLVSNNAPSIQGDSEGTSQDEQTATENHTNVKKRHYGYQSKTNSNPRQDTSNAPDVQTIAVETITLTPPTWKLTIVMSAVKTVCIFGFSILFYAKVFPGRPAKDWVDGWGHLGSQLITTDWVMFAGNICGSFFGYFTAYIACTTCMHRFGFTVPLTLFSTPLSYVTFYVMCEKDVLGESTCNMYYNPYSVIALVLLVAAQTISTGYLLFRSQFLVMLKEDKLFWTPMYTSGLLEQWLMLSKKTEYHDEHHEYPVLKASRTKVIICTTMYREADYEMRQLLKSIKGINRAQKDGTRHFESHIFFDGAVKDVKPTDSVLQLVYLAEEELGVKAKSCKRNETPYGMSIEWELINSKDHRMLLRIHLKDNQKVKNKKRWSQVMYMSYVLDFFLKQENNCRQDECFILTTDADVCFNVYSVEALLDLMTRDPSIGAVCARTHPIGSGPIVWYQLFEYAIGHWFQKAAEHVVGSVLCSPGCFSVYRCSAIRDILPEYATNVEHAFDFLTKDMGEDRWLCTLMVQSGWRIEYCAAAKNSTHCPEDFDEFFKQRRRWVVSTLANLALLVKEWSTISTLNHRVSVVFLLYQVVHLFATLIGPSSIILVVTGGLSYAWSINSTMSVLLQVVVMVLYALVCLTTSSKTQLNAAKFLSVLYTIVMAAVMVGTAVQVAKEISKADDAKLMHESFPISTTTLYLAIMVGIFLLTGLMHPSEFYCLLHGFWFFLCIPAGYLILMIYSICNITDQSWGTREVKEHSVRVVHKNWQDRLIAVFKEVFFCCFTRKQTRSIASGPEEGPPPINQQPDANDDDRAGIANAEENAKPIKDGKGESVEKWLERDFTADDSVITKFKDNGFENTIFISKMTENELKDIGITSSGQKHYLMERIKKLPDFEVVVEVPKDVDSWLDTIGLLMYQENFKKEKITSSTTMEVLKTFSRSKIEQELKITKIGHIKRLMHAIAKLRNPTSGERKIVEARKELDKSKLQKMCESNQTEHEFWNKLLNLRLVPQSTAYELEEDLKRDLAKLRNKWIAIFAVFNAVWMVLIYTLATQEKLLSVANSNPVGLVVLVIFSFVLCIQFIAMIIHRLTTATHFLARARYRYGAKYNARDIAETNRPSSRAEVNRNTRDRRRHSDEEQQPFLSREDV